MSATIEHIRLSVPDVSCSHCVAAVDEALSGMAGVSAVTTDLGTKQVSVAYDPASVSVDSLSAALDEAGYPVAGSASN
ncbi:MAG TPA: heavy-metal-associated domain-containing protein [Thermomicrobiales bacterium]|jgi:copper ion binding protein|nr:heavy-metal-associated domain-containing protein [Thermomicrobiales bacterium]